MDRNGRKRTPNSGGLDASSIARIARRGDGRDRGGIVCADDPTTWTKLWTIVNPWHTDTSLIYSQVAAQRGRDLRVRRRVARRNGWPRRVLEDDHEENKSRLFRAFV